jgi:hypothetical protein
MNENFRIGIVSVNEVFEPLNFVFHELPRTNGGPCEVRGG